ncbi:MAG: PilN domain-containing protein [Gemmatimonadota bacterium]
MIQVNLLPGAIRKRTARRMPKIAAMGSLSRFTGLPQLDRLALFAVVAWLTMLPLTGYMFLSSRSRVDELNVSIEGALADSTKYANIIAANRRLLERRDTIAQKVNIIQQIDAGRYIWPHIMDEVSRALPPYTWLVSVQGLPADSAEMAPNFRIDGRTGNNFALTKYLQDLEASPFIRAVKLSTTELVRENEKLVYSFSLEASYEEPPPDVIETVPLFSKEPE